MYIQILKLQYILYYMHYTVQPIFVHYTYIYKVFILL